jgi:DNA-directed RNA polymerase specialized sigma24 family protein
MIRKEYHPVLATGNETAHDPRRALADDIAHGMLTADELERRYFTLVYAQTGSYEETARRLKLNWRTVKSKIDHQLYEKLTREQRTQVP